MNIIDLLLSVFLLLGLVRGLFKGFLSELAGLLALLAGIYAAIHFSDVTQSFLQSLFTWKDQYMYVLAFALTFFLAALLVSLAGSFLTKVVHLMALGLVNRLLGGIFGLIKMAFLASLFLMFFENFPLFKTKTETREASVLYAPVRRLAPLLLPRIVREVQKENLLEDSAPEEKKP